MFDRGDRALVHVDVYRHPVARLRQDLGLDIGVVTPLLHILALQFQLHALQGGALEHLPHGQAGALETVQQGLGLDGLVALYIDLTDAGALRHHDHQHIAVTADVNVVEIAGGEQAAGRGAQHLRVDHVPHRHGQGRKHGARGHPLQTLHPDIGHDECLGKCQRSQQQQGQS